MSPNLRRGYIAFFDCCLEGRKSTRHPDGKYRNIDGENAGHKNHPFLIISDDHKNNASFTRYVHAIPISSSKSKYNQEKGLPLTKDMFSSDGGEMLISNQSILKVDSIVSIHIPTYSGTGIIAEISPNSTPYKKILSEVIKNFGCKEII